jgi:hypothetical protein
MPAKRQQLGSQSSLHYPHGEKMSGKKYAEGKNFAAAHYKAKNS